MEPFSFEKIMRLNHLYVISIYLILKSKITFLWYLRSICKYHLHWFSSYFFYFYVAKDLIQTIEAKMQQFVDVLIKRNKKTSASMQTKLQVMHYTDHNEEVFYCTVLLRIHNILLDWFG